MASNDAVQHTQCVLSGCSAFSHLKLVFRQPIVTGTSVLAIKYKDGIMMAADNLGSSSPPFITLGIVNISPI